MFPQRLIQSKMLMELSFIKVLANYPYFHKQLLVFGKITKQLAILLIKTKHTQKLLKKQEKENGIVKIFSQDLK